MKSSSLASLVVALGLSVVVAACGDDDDDFEDGVNPPDITPPVGDVAARNAQIERGKNLYVANCASCHGAAGQGTATAPPLVGPDALPLNPRPGQARDEQFITAGDVYDFAREYMPFNDPGSLEDVEYLDIVAFDLDANGLTWTGALEVDDLRAIAINEGPKVP